MAILTGAKVITEEIGMKLENVEMDDLGKARKIVATKDNTTIVEGVGSQESIKFRLEQIKEQIKNSTSDFDREKLEERYAKLSGGVAVLRVGAATETEMKEIKHRVEDAIAATKAAVEEGIVVGGGVALIRVLPVLNELEIEGEEKVGLSILKKALEEPAKQIALNAGKDGSVVVEEIKKHTGGFGYNAEKNKYEDLIQAGIIDPTKVTRLALQNAGSIASLILTTEVVIAELPSKDNEKNSMPAGMGMGGGMM
jgi:chaperonin GroEL